MITGVPNFLPSIQNFSIPEVVLQDGNDVLNYKAQFNNVTLYGLESYKFKRYNGEENGVDFLKPVKTIPKFKVGNVVDYGFDGLFGNSEEINKIAKHVIDDNLSIIVEELLPTIEKVLVSFFDNFIFKSVTRIPYDKLYPK
nr:unnamed protein product [Callosobruchus chinensis]